MLKFLLVFILALNLNAGMIWDATKTATKIGISVGVKKAIQVAKTKKVHGNSLDYKGNTHVYAIKNDEGILKIGESSQGLNSKDLSKRAELQASKLRRTTGDSTYTSKILKNFDNKKNARIYETKLIEKYRAKYGKDKNDKSVLIGNKTNR